ncbi:uncharacterized protein LOC6732883 [Drosophila simulans]|uniref:GD24238 n=1 Tax=Drosophila simulans TaxID=7240 RepID=B4QAF6_DROSI|nr:uncharacterized protein LOC6732883 [Drosophila simulans]EDX05573.1 GD24238 [Drosophila simulans]KMY91111.1 uncharacterized protein Dsimw501_GD24238 [Drosophila simulans]
MLPLQFVLLGCLFIAQGICHTLPEPKLRVPRETISIPTHLFKPVSPKSSREPISNRSSLNGGNSSALVEADNDVEFLERSSGEVEEVTDAYEEEDVPLRPIPFQPRPFYPQSPPRSNGFPIRQPIYDNAFQTDYNVGPRGSGFDNRPFPSSPDFRGRGGRPIPDSPFRNQNSGTFVSRPVPMSSSGSIIPLISGGLSVPTGRSGPLGSGGSSNNFYRSESYSYTSDGRGPPQIERDLYDSRDGFGSSYRNF